MRVLSLFSGIGGLDLGLERAGMTVVGQCEIDPYCRAVLAKHWPGVRRFGDVKALTGRTVEYFCGQIDIIAGGFPCQPFSVAGKGLGKHDERHLWPEYARLISELRPAWVLAENVPGLRTRGADEVWDDLAALGYSQWPLVVGAEHVGAPHRRDRVWIVAVSDAELRKCGSGHEPAMQRGRTREAEQTGVGGCDGGGELAHPARGGLGADGTARDGGGHADERGESVADAHGERGCSGTTRREDAADARLAGQDRWPSGPGQPQHAWEDPRLVESGVGFTTSRFARWLARFGLAVSVLPESHQLVSAYGIQAKAGPGEVLQELRRSYESMEEREWPAGRHERVQAKSVLLAYLLCLETLRAEEVVRNTVESDVPPPRQETPEKLLRVLWFNYTPRRSPHRPRPQKQRHAQPPNSLLDLSRLLALNCEEDWKRYCRSDAAAMGLIRRNALRALGNSVVPQVVEAIGRAIMEHHTSEPAPRARRSK